MKILQKLKKRLVIFTQGIFPPILKKIRTLVDELQMLTDGPTDRPTTRHGNRSSGPKNYTAHPHDLVHVPAKFRENTAMRF